MLQAQANWLSAYKYHFTSVFGSVNICLIIIDNIPLSPWEWSCTTANSAQHLTRQQHQSPRSDHQSVINKRTCHYIIEFICISTVCCMFTNSHGSWHVPRLPAWNLPFHGFSQGIICKPSLVGFLFCRRHQQTRQIPQQMQISQLLQPDDFTHCWTIWCGRSISLKPFYHNLTDFVLNRLLPNNKISMYYLRSRAHNFALTSKSCFYDNCNFITRMLFKGTGPIDQF